MIRRSSPQLPCSRKLLSTPRKAHHNQPSQEGIRLQLPEWKAQEQELNSAWLISSWFRATQLHFPD